MHGYREDDGTVGTDAVVGTRGPGIPRDDDGGVGGWRWGRILFGRKGHGWGRGQRKGGVG